MTDQPDVPTLDDVLALLDFARDDAEGAPGDDQTMALWLTVGRIITALDEIHEQLGRALPPQR